MTFILGKSLKKWQIVYNLRLFIVKKMGTYFFGSSAVAKWFYFPIGTKKPLFCNKGYLF